MTIYSLSELKKEFLKFKEWILTNGQGAFIISELDELCEEVINRYDGGFSLQDFYQPHYWESILKNLELPLRLKFGSEWKETCEVLVMLWKNYQSSLLRKQTELEQKEEHEKREQVGKEASSPEPKVEISTSSQTNHPLEKMNLCPICNKKIYESAVGKFKGCNCDINQILEFIININWKEKETQAKSETIKLLRAKIEKLENPATFNNETSELQTNLKTSRERNILLTDQIRELEAELKRISEGLQGYTDDDSLYAFVVAESSKQKLEDKELILTNQLEQKQKEVEVLREKLETTNNQLTQTTSELDNSLFARYEAVKQFGIVYEKVKDLRLQLTQTEDEASEELINQDQEISKLRNQQRQFKLKIGELEKDLDMAQRLAEMRKDNVPFRSRNYSADLAPDYLRILLWSLMAGVFMWWLSSKK